MIPDELLVQCDAVCYWNKEGYCDKAKIWITKDGKCKYKGGKE